MRFLADESCDFAVVVALRAAGHDVTLVRERCPGAEDLVVAAVASSENRILLTEDKDFGLLAQAVSGVRVGVILIRFPTRARAQLGESAVAAVERLGGQLEGAFVVLEPGLVRVSRP